MNKTSSYKCSPRSEQEVSYKCASFGGLFFFCTEHPPAVQKGNLSTIPVLRYLYCCSRPTAWIIDQQRRGDCGISLEINNHLGNVYV